MKIGIGQINAAVGDFERNFEKILSASKTFAENGADFAVFPEGALTGYPLRDLTFYTKFVEKTQTYLQRLAEQTPLPILVGGVRKSGLNVGVFDSAFWLEDGKIKYTYDKILLPNYGTLNDPRNFDSGSDFLSFEFEGAKIGITVCEDIWTLPSVSTSARYSDKHLPLDHFEAMAARGEKLDLLVNISASVFSSTNDNVRAKNGMLFGVSQKIHAPVLWCNLVGGCDEIVFAGGSCYVDAAAEKSKTLPKFREAFEIVDTDAISGYDGDAADFDGIADIHAALVMALRDFVSKVGSKKVLIGLSGGIDSAVVAALAVEALGADAVMGVSMPSKISSEHSKDDARSLAENLGIKFDTVGIADIVSATEKTLAPVFAGRPRDVAEENIQSRSRGLVLMAISNKFGSLVLTTGNKSECAVGYCTLYGDTCGAFAPICDVYKTDVYKLANYINKTAGREIIPQNTIDKPPSAELRPDQKDEDSLPPYDLLDAVLRLHIDEYKSVSEIVALGYPREVVEDVARKVARCEYKRTQYPIGPKLTPVSFAADRKILVCAKRGAE